MKHPSGKTPFDTLVERAIGPSHRGMRPVVEKEILHYDILHALDRNGLLDTLVFQGGTSLRLCYGASRFSEDLDFAGGTDFTSQQLKDLKTCIEDNLGSRYGLAVKVKEPTSLRMENIAHGIKIDKWQVGIVTRPKKPDMPMQRIKLEVANVPAHTRIALPLVQNYDTLPDSYSDILVMVEKKDEIMADKLVALPMTEKYIRHRDIWDLTWLTQRGASLDTTLVLAKARDYQIDLLEYGEKIDKITKRLPAIISGKPFHDEMMRFLPSNIIEGTLDKEKFQSYLTHTVTGLLNDVKDSMDMLGGDPLQNDTTPTFKM